MSGGGLGAILVAAFALAACGTPVVRRVAFRVGMLDLPSPRKLHDRPVPLLGGVAIWAAVIGPLLFLVERAARVELAAILTGATWIALWGLLDDRRGLAVRAKLAVQIAAVVPLHLAGVRVDLPVPEWLGLALTVLWVVGVTNALNLLDNMDGLAGIVGGAAAAAFLVLAAPGERHAAGALAAAVLGACLGFLVHNLRPARVFMGDSGSLFLGFVLAALGLKLQHAGGTTGLAWTVPVLVLGLPILDTTLVVVARTRAGKNPFTTPGRDHVSHRLLRLGWSTKATALALGLAGCAFGALALLLQRSAIGGGP